MKQLATVIILGGVLVCGALTRAQQQDPAGPMPSDVTSLSFPAIQTYSSGEEVSWIDQPTSGGAEPNK